MSDRKEAPRRRALNSEVDQARTAIAFVRPVNRRIAEWQQELAFLRALGSSSGHRPGAIAELARRVSAEQVLLIEAVAGLPPQVASHGRIEDTRKALQRLAGQLDAEIRNAGEDTDDWTPPPSSSPRSNQQPR